MIFFRSVFGEAADDTRNLSDTIRDHLVPALTDAVEFYKHFASQQSMVLDAQLTFELLQVDAGERDKYTEEGLRLARKAEGIFLPFKNEAGLVNTKVIFVVLVTGFSAI